MKALSGLVCVDLDGTVLSGDPAREASFRQWASRRPKSLILAYNSGRSVESMRAEIGIGRLPIADYLIAHLGTRVETMEGPAEEIESRLFNAVDPAWNQAALMANGPGPGVMAQETERLNQYKASFYWDGDPNTLRSFYARIEAIMPKAVWRSMEVEGQYLDIMPMGVGKGAATMALASHLGLAAGHIIVSGDSENDQDLLCLQGVRKILPSNAVGLLRQLAPDAYQSPFPDAAGLLDGLRLLGMA